MIVPSISSLKTLILFMLPALTLVIFPLHDAFSFVDNQNASLVLGQPDFTSNLIPMRPDPDCMSIPSLNCHPDEPVLPNVLYRPTYIVFDSHGNLWVSDTGNNRVLEFVPPFHDGQNASMVLGQPDLKSELNWPPARGPVIPPYGISYHMTNNVTPLDTVFHKEAAESSVPKLISENITKSVTYTATPNAFNSPNGITFDSQGNLWVVDSDNNRILEFRPPFTNYMNASLVIGQDDFDGSWSKGDKNGFFNPLAVTFDSRGNLWVADCFMTRVLEFESPFHNGMNASLVIGQPDFTSYSPSTSPTGMFQPYSLEFDRLGNLWVVDGANIRVLEYSPPFYDGMPAALVIGQTNFTVHEKGIGPNRFFIPVSLSFDKQGGLWIFDENNRVLDFEPPFHNGMNASIVIGQMDFTRSNSGLTQNQLGRGPDYVTFDNDGNLWVSENGNNRILEFSAKVTTVPEFPFAIPVLLIGVTSLIVFYKTKIRIYTSISQLTRT